jgi:hypothetical protein
MYGIEGFQNYVEKRFMLTFSYKGGTRGRSRPKYVVCVTQSRIPSDVSYSQSLFRRKKYNPT